PEGDPPATAVRSPTHSSPSRRATSIFSRPGSESMPSTSAVSAMSPASGMCDRAAATRCGSTRAGPAWSAGSASTASGLRDLKPDRVPMRAGWLIAAGPATARTRAVGLCGRARHGLVLECLHTQGVIGVPKVRPALLCGLWHTLRLEEDHGSFLRHRRPDDVL